MRPAATNIPKLWLRVLLSLRFTTPSSRPTNVANVRVAGNPPHTPRCYRLGVLTPGIHWRWRICWRRRSRAVDGVLSCTDVLELLMLWFVATALFRPAAICAYIHKLPAMSRMAGKSPWRYAARNKYKVAFPTLAMPTLARSAAREPQ
jgi:hypothetical protein